MEYAIAFGIALGLNLILFVPAFIFKTDKLTDLSYALSFFIVAGMLYFFSGGALGHILLMSMVALWALRLGTYLYIRIRKIDRDTRFDGIRESFPRFFKFWFLQGVSVFIILLPSIPYFAMDVVVLTPLSYVGLLVWLIALLIESIADYQKYTFINDPENKGKWIESGLWKYSRHPNYFGEILLWVGVYLFVLPELSVLAAGVGLLGPLYITYIILFVTGIPMLEKSADERWGDDPAYQEYKRKTNILLPNPLR